ncbi:MAG: cytochrome c oxidase subunit II [Oligoflexia bacterium]|nr:cytochrome c oxidase subunit II [Oligoflexia bacterium]
MFEKIFNGDLPLKGTQVAGSWDSLYNFLVWLSVFFFLLVVGGMVIFAMKYRADRQGAKAKYITGSHLLEAVWIAVPTVLLLIIFAWGYNVYRTMTHAPADAYEVRVIGKQWLWTFLYENGRTTVNDLYVPMNRPVKLIMTSEDVLHSFFVPNFRVKQDVVPGMYTSVWFEPTMPGKHRIFCAEYCGTSHSGMIGQVIALEAAQWKAWSAGKEIGPVPQAGLELTAAEKAHSGAAGAVLTLAERGAKVFAAKGCAACHSIDGSARPGPTLKGVFGHEVEFGDGGRALVDENYLRESIERPQARVVKGFQPIMPTFQGLVSETELSALLAYIKSLK